MLLKTLATGSTGNAYEISDGNTTLLFECGLPVNKLRRACGRPLTDYSGVFISHEHMDHARAALDVAQMGICVYATGGTAQAIGLMEYYELERVPGRSRYEQADVGTISVVPFRVIHDATEPVGFLVYSAHTCEKLLFATDTRYIPARFNGLTEIAIECNHDLRLYEDEDLPAAIIARIARTHMSLERALDVLANNDMTRVQRIHLLHLSDRHSSAGEFCERVYAASGVPATIG